MNAGGSVPPGVSTAGSCVTDGHSFLYKRCGFGSHFSRMVIVRQQKPEEKKKKEKKTSTLIELTFLLKLLLYSPKTKLWSPVGENSFLSAHYLLVSLVSGFLWIPPTPEGEMEGSAESPESGIINNKTKKKQHLNVLGQ